MARPSPRVIPIQATPGAPLEQALYEVRRAIHPRAVRGWFAAWRWLLVWATQLVYYGLAWLPWNDRQAVLFDIAQRQFYIFGLVFWPQDVIYLTVLLIISALALFLFTAVAGRLWCGYACPQTVYTEIFMWIERRIEGDRSARIRLDRENLSLKKLMLKAEKHALWIGLSLWTGFTFVGYFTPIRGLWAEVMAFKTGPWETFWIFFYGFATYGNAGWMREQVCIYMCPYARFQSAMFDKDTLIITYDGARGEPRAKLSGRAEASGDCVDCGICVQVCPTGIDIREGLQYQCIGCAACIDGCDQVMDKVGRARGLIRYATTNAIERKLTRAEMFRRALRPRVMLYTAILWTIIVAAGAALYLRVPLKVDVIRDRAVISREIAGGDVENLYQLMIMNTSELPRIFDIEVTGLPGIHLNGDTHVELPGAGSRVVPLRARAHFAPGSVAPGRHRIHFLVHAHDDPSVFVHEKSVFILR